MKDQQASYPQLRFKGCTDPWEKRRLGDISEKVTEKNSDNEFSETLTNSAEYGIISQRDFFDKDISNEKNLNTYYVVRDGDFVYNPRISNFAPVGPIKRNTLGRTGVMSPLYYIFRAHNVDGMYLEKYFSSTKWHRFMELNGDTGARADRFAIKDKDFVQMPIPLPNLEEQSKIARFLENVDNLIAANQRKLDLLKEQKKGYLQKMFPKNGAKVPELRFAGFADAWEERKLGELANIVRGASPRPIQDPKWFDKDSDIGWLRISDVTEQDGRIRHLEQRISKLGQEKTRVLMEPHLLLSIAATVGKPLVNYVKTGVHDGFLIFLNPVFDREFMFQWLDMFRPKWKKYGQPGSQVNLNSELVRNQEIDLPRIEEQQQIGSFFKQLDDIIALHQRKLEKLQELKKGYLQKMFC